MTTDFFCSPPIFPSAKRCHPWYIRGIVLTVLIFRVRNIPAPFHIRPYCFFVFIVPSESLLVVFSPRLRMRRRGRCSPTRTPGAKGWPNDGVDSKPKGKGWTGLVELLVAHEPCYYLLGMVEGVLLGPFLFTTGEAP